MIQDDKAVMERFVHILALKDAELARLTKALGRIDELRWGLGLSSPQELFSRALRIAAGALRIAAGALAKGAKP